MVSGDPYLWLENLDDPRTREFIERHRRRLREFLGDLPDKLYPRVLEGLSDLEVIGYDTCRNDTVVLARKGNEYIVELLGGGYRKVVRDRVVWGVFLSPDCRLLAVGSTQKGSDVGIVEIIDVSDGRIVDKIEGSVYGIVWAPDGRILYARMYRTGKTPDGVEAPAERIIGRDPASGEEEIVWGTGLGRNEMVSLHPYYRENALQIVVYKGWHEQELYQGRLDDPETWKRVLAPKAPVAPAGVVDEYGYAIVYDGEGYGRIVRVPLEGGSPEEVLRAKGRHPISDAIATSGMITATILVDGRHVLHRYSPDGSLLWSYEPEWGPASMRGLGASWDGEVYVLVESFCRPQGLYKAGKDGLELVWGEREGLVGCDRLAVGEGWVESRDGTRVHYFWSRYAETGRVLVYGYGGFGISLTPRYLGYAKPLLDEGFEIVYVNLRGGGEYGEAWHRAGMRRNKHKVFEDMEAVLSHYKEKGYRVAAIGGSNGGLLVAAVLVRSPDLLDAALIGYPVIDMLRFHKLYIGSLWVSEYGDPENPEDRDYLRRISPLHNVKKGARYPPTLVYTGLHDDRVHPGHALRFAAVLEDAGAPVYLRVEEEAGHMGARVEVKARELADLWAFLLRVLG